MSATSLHPPPILLSSMSTAIVKPTLPEMLATVPHLLQTCVPSWAACTFKTLRLVSKDVSVTVMSMVTECSVQLGDNALPAPRGLEKMFKHSRLTSVTIKFTTSFSTTSGETTPLGRLQAFMVDRTKLATCWDAVPYTFIKKNRKLWLESNAVCQPIFAGLCSWMLSIES